MIVHSDESSFRVKVISKESGRSMLEMLGVLAIVGVLSVGALAGYSQAMAMHKINQTIDMLDQIVVAVDYLYGDQATYEDLSVNVLKKSGVLPDNMFIEF
ncbi:MAG: hypothetical protein GY804_04930 [Alphaproteobacteria bacterium]|nr:hypothetical protein [Alphaproteobacteria bacterium]